MLSVGVDIIEIDRIARALDRFGDRFLRRVYTPAEVVYCRNKIPPQDLRITAVDAMTGQLQIELLGQWLEPFKQFKGRKNPIHTSLFEGHAVATCLLPASLFETPE